MASFYCHCAHLVLLALDQQSSLKAIVSSRCSAPNYSPADQKRYLATVIGILAWRSALLDVITRANLTIGEQAKQTSRVLGPIWRKYVAEQQLVQQGGRQSSGNRARSHHLDADNSQTAHQTLLLVLVHEVLVSPSKRISASPSWPPAKWLASLRPRLQAELVKLQIAKGKSRVEELRSDSKTDSDSRSSRDGAERGRWLRVNTRTSSLDDVVQWLDARGYKRCHGSHIALPTPPSSSSRKNGTSRTSASHKQYLVPSSIHPPNLILLPMQATADIVRSDLYTAGKIILQDAASCWPAWLLLSSLLQHDDAKSSSPIHVLDATAAPGNKTSHLSALLSEIYSAAHSRAEDHQGASVPADSQLSLTAFEKDAGRYKTLCSQLSRARALRPLHSAAKTSDANLPGSVTALRADFLSVQPDASSGHDYERITHMLLDPSCSGSGITGRLDWLTKQAASSSSGAKEAPPEDAEQADEETDAASGDSEEDRLRRLADVQLRMIEHAFTFPNLQRFVYSTCSIHQIEDEDVVFRALASPLASSSTASSVAHARSRDDSAHRKRKRSGQDAASSSGQHDRPWKWTLAPRQECLPDWPWRGRLEAVQSQAASAPASSSSPSAHSQQEQPRLLDSMLRAYPSVPIVPPSDSNLRPATDDVASEATQGESGDCRGPMVHEQRINGFFAACFQKVYLDEETPRSAAIAEKKASALQDGADESANQRDAGASEQLNANEEAQAERKRAKAREKKKRQRLRHQAQGSSTTSAAPTAL